MCHAYWYSPTHTSLSWIISLPFATCFYMCLSTEGSDPVHAGILSHPRSRHTLPPPSRHPLSPADGYCCRRYTSYWNEFLFIEIIGNSTGQSSTRTVPFLSTKTTTAHRTTNKDYLLIVTTGYPIIFCNKKSLLFRCRLCLCPSSYLQKSE